jgi:electron transport complex protein RnfG
MLDDRIDVPAGDPLLKLPEARAIYLARREGVPTAALIPVVAPDGYSGTIELLVGVERSGRIAGVRVLKHRETPGLGDAIDHRKSDWIEGFRGRSIGDPPLERWTVSKDGGAFDAFTGATITPRAVIRATARALQFVDRHHEDIFRATPADTLAVAPGPGGK